MADQKPSSTTTPTQIMTPDGLTALARCLRAHADGIRNPAAKEMGDAMRAVADVIEQLEVATGAREVHLFARWLPDRTLADG